MMKSTINLYQDQFKPNIQLINLHFCLAVWGLVLLILIGFGYSTSRVYASKQAQLAEVEHALEQRNQQISQLSNLYGNAPTQDTKLLQVIKQAEQNLQQMQWVADELGRREQQKSQGFSALMLDLARHHQPEIWLTRIRASQNSMHLEGGAADSVSVPAWINTLSEAESFKGKEFATAHMYLDDHQQLNFVLSADLDQAAGEPGE